jgi:hypothetical protein
MKDSDTRKHLPADIEKHVFGNTADKRFLRIAGGVIDQDHHQEKQD